MTKNIFEEESTSETQASGGDAKIRKQARQLAYDVRYKVKQSLKKGEESNDASLKRAYLQQLNSSPAPGAVKRVAKTMLIGESYDFVDIAETAKESVDKILSNVFVKKTELEDADGNSAFEVTEFAFGEEKSDREKKYKVRVTDKKGKKTYVRMADRKKIGELRKGDEVSSVEMTGYGVPNEEKGKKKVVKKAKKDFDGDGKLESPEAEYKGSKDKAIKKAVAKEGYQRDPERLKKDKTHSKQPDPSKDGFTGIGNMSIKDIMKMNKKMKKEEVVAKESVGSAIDKGLGAVGDTAKVAGKAAVGGVKVAGKVAKGTAKAAATVVGTPIGVAKSIKKGWKAGTQSESVGSAVDKALGAVGDTAKVAGKTAVGTVKVAGKVAKGAAKAAGQIAGTPIGVAKAVKKGFKSGTQSESVGSAIDKGLGAVGDTAKVAGKAAVGTVKVAGKVAKGAAKAAGRIAGTPIGVAKSIKKGWQAGTASESIDPSVQSAVDALNTFDNLGGSQIDEAERSLGDRLHRKRKLYDKTTKKAMQFARDEGEASGHARYRMSSISREMDGIKAKMKKEEVQSMLDYAWSLNMSEHHTKDANGKIIEHEDTTPSSVEEGVIDIVKKGAKRHAKAVEKKKIKNRKAVPYAALAAENELEGEELKEYSPNVTYQAKGGKKSGKLGKSSVYSLRDKDESKKEFRKSQVKDIKGGYLKTEEKKKGLDGKECWDGYELVGTKKKGGKTVDDCVKVKEDYYRGTGEKVVARTKKWMDKKGQKGAPGLDAMKARSAEHKAKRGVKEDFVTEVIEKDNPDANVKKIDVMKGKNKVKINPNMGEQVETDTKQPEDVGLKQKEKQANMLKKRVLMQKLKAVRSGAGDSIMASHTPEGKVVEAAGCGTDVTNKGKRKVDPKKNPVVEGSAYGITKGDGKAKGAMKDYLDKRAEKLKKEKANQSAPYRNNPAFGDPSHHSNAKNKTEEVQIEAKVDQGRSDYGKASIRNYRRSGPGHGEPAMFDSENKRGKTIDKRREEHKARRGVKGAKVPAYKVNESHATAKKPSERAAIAKLEAILKRKEDLKKKTKGVKEEVIPRGPGGNPIRIKDRIKAAKGFIPNKGKPTTEEVVSELNRYGKETGKATGSINKRAGTPVKTGGSTDKVLNYVRTKIRKETGKPTGQTPKIKGEKGRVQYGDRRTTPADSIAKRRESRADAERLMRDTSGT